MSDSLALIVSKPHVYLGIWTNWSYGSVHGSTLTLTRNNGNILNAALTLFVALSGTCLWRLVCFGLHHGFSSDTPQDGLHHQRQAILRTSGTGIAGLWSFIRITWAWRKQASDPCSRMAPLIGLAVCLVAAFGAAGVFSSRLSRAAMTDEALLSGDNCGFVDTSTILHDGQAVFTPWMSQVASSSADYARRCYEQGSTREDCPAFMQVKLTTDVERDAGCPFDEAICRSQSGNIRLDTGYLNSHYHLGMNAPREERFLYRRVTECAPLKTEGFTVNLTTTDEVRDSIGYLYGMNLGKLNVTDGQALTYIHSSQKKFDGLDSILYRERGNYDIAVYTRYAGSLEDQQSTFEPIQELHRPDADVSVFFLSANNVLFIEQVDDPVYGAHRPCGENVVGGKNFYSNLYCSDSPTTVLACSHQHQMCDASRDPEEGCLPLLGMRQLWLNLTEEGRSPLSPAAEKAASLVADSSLGDVSVADTVDILGASALTARECLSSSFSGPLPSDQWQNEVEHWDYTSLASIQRQIFDMANGPANEEFDRYLKRPTEDFERKFCHNQKIVSTDHSSFSVLKIAVLFSIGLTIISISYSIEWIVETVQKRRNQRVYSRLEWAANDTLQLQRLAHEELGFGTWSAADGSYPVTQKGDMLATLNISDDAHPKLSRLVQTYQYVVGEDSKSGSGEKLLSGNHGSTMGDDLIRRV